MKDTHWHTPFRTGVELLDTHHRRLSQFSRDIQQATMADDALGKLRLIEELYEYASRHLAEEEALMRHHHYPLNRSNNHKDLHASFLARIHLHAVHARRGEDITGTLLHELRNWIANHVEREDKALAPYFGKLPQPRLAG